MRKNIVLILLISVFIFLVGCSNTATKPTDELEVEETSYETNESPVIEEKTEAESEEFIFIKLLQDTSSDKIKAVIKQNAENEWKTDYEMVKYIYDKQVEAYNNVMQIVNHQDLSGTVNERIIEDALNEWGTDFEMVMYVYEKQLTAWKDMQGN